MGQGDAWPAARPGEEEDASAQGAEGPEQGGRARHLGVRASRERAEQDRGACGGFAASARGGRPAAKAPKKPLIQEILSEGEAATLGGPCLTGHEISNKRGKVSVRGGLAPGLSIADLSVDLDEAKRALVFSSPGLDAVTVALPEGTGTGVAAKYSQSSHRVTVKIT